MARLIVGGDEGGFYAHRGGGAFGDSAYVLWSALTGGTRYVDVLHIDGSAAGSGTVNGTAYTGGVLLTGHIDGSFGAQLPDAMDVPGAWIEFDDHPVRVYLAARQADGTPPASAQAAAAVAAEATARQNADTAVQNAAATDATTKANAAQAAAVQRANHTGTQPAGTITGLAAVATSGAKADVGLGNVDNTSDANKPVSTAQAAALVPQTRTVAGKPLTADVTLVKADVGLTAVDNTADANKPVSTAQANADTAVQAAAKTAADGSYATVVQHGSTAGTARPAGAVRVFWRGSVAPTNAAQYDRWINDSASPYTESIYTGSAWTSLGGSSSPVENVNTVAASGAAVTLPDVTTATMHDVTLTANCTLTFPALGAGKSFTLRLNQDATGARTVTWPGTVKWSGGAAPVLSTGASKQDVLTFVSIAGSSWSGFLAGLDLR